MPRGSGQDRRVTSDALPTTAVLLPGTGSDQVFVTAAFAGPVAAAGLRLHAPAPRPGKQISQDHLKALDEAARVHPIVVGGISLGAHLAAEWAAANPDRCLGLLLALPAWHGPAGPAPAAAAARASADSVDALGLPEALAAATAGVPDWLAAELTRAWTGYGDGLAASLRAAAGHPAPTLADLAGIAVPTGIAACADDPVHPAAEAHTWAGALPAAAVATTTLAALSNGLDHLGAAAVRAWQEAGGRAG
jgi:pimeloyl-ACP methyl ester carboxylesterase